MKHVAALAFSALTVCAAPAMSLTADASAPPQKHPMGHGACKADAEKLCSGVQPGGGRILACMKANKDKLSDACKASLEKHRAGKPNEENNSDKN